MYHVTTDTLGFTTGGSEAVRITSAGVVGIGSTSPASTAKLAVAGSIVSDWMYATSSDSATFPAFSWFNDQNTGLFRAAADTLGFTTGGSERARLTSAGFFGIGTSSPAAKLSVTGGIIGDNFFGTTSDSVSAPSFSWFNDQNTGLFNAAADTIGFTTGGSERMRIDSSGNIGIGTTTPDTRLTINDSAAVLLKLQRNGGTDANTALVFDGLTTDFHIGYNGTNFAIDTDATLSSAPLLVVTPTGLLGVNATSPEGTIEGEANEGTDASLVLDADQGDENVDTWFITSRASDNGLAFTNHTSERMRLTSDGFLGIGTSTPAASLNINKAIDNPGGGSVTDGIRLSFEDSGTLSIGDGLGISFYGPDANGGFATTKLSSINTIKESDADGSTAVALTFSTNDGSTFAENMRLTGAGYLGIGTSTPGVPLQVYEPGGPTSFIVGSQQEGKTWGVIQTTADTGGYLNIASVVNGTIGNIVLNGDGTGHVAIGTTSPLGTLHVATGGSGQLSPNTNADDLVIEGSAASGLSILTPNNVAQRIAFGDPQNASIGLITYNHSTDSMTLTVNGSTALTIDSALGVTIPGNLDGTTGDFSSTLTLSGSAANIALGSNWLSGDGADEGVFVSSTGLVGIGDATPSQLLDVDGTDPQGLFEESTTEFLRVGVGETAGTSILGWDDSDSLRLGIYSSPTDTTIVDLLTILSTGEVGIGSTTPRTLLTLSDATGPTTTYSRADTALLHEDPFGTLQFEGNDANAGRIGAYAAIGAIAIDPTGAGASINASANEGGGLTFSTAIDTAGSAALVLRERMRLDQFGRLGIGSTTPIALLSLSATSGGSTPIMSISSSTSGAATSTYFHIISNGFVGIGTTTPTAQLTNTGTVRFAALTGAGANLVVDGNGNVTVSSDERLKDIEGTFARGIEALRGIEPITYKWKKETGYDTVNSYTGFSAQNVQSMIPEAVGVDRMGHLTLADRPIIAATVNAIKDLDARWLELGTTTTAAVLTEANTGTTTLWTTWEETTSESLQDKVLALGDMSVRAFKDAIYASVGIFERVFAREVHTDTLCVGDTCVTETELAALLAANGQQGTPTPTPEPEYVGNDDGDTGTTTPEVPAEDGDTEEPVVEDPVGEETPTVTPEPEPEPEIAADPEPEPEAPADEGAAASAPSEGEPAA